MYIYELYLWKEKIVDESHSIFGGRGTFRFPPYPLRSTLCFLYRISKVDTT